MYARVLKFAVVFLLALTCAAGAKDVRTKSNFNADWQFTLGDPAGAERAAFDDKAWQRVGLPHSFSIPYFQASRFYAGTGWYRKHLKLARVTPGHRYALEFEGAFQEVEVFVNGLAVGRHRGGYTGFPVDVTSALHAGDNMVAVRVNNTWNPQLAPRAGEHVFSGGLYRDVWLVETDAVHVTWTGTRITTPDLSQDSGRVAAETEIRNDGAKPADVTLRTRIVAADGKTVAVLPDEKITVAPGATRIAKQTSAPVPHPQLWSPQTPVLYRAVTDVVAGAGTVDHCETEFGFRWFEWTADRGFFLNGHHYYFRGANVHQDQAGWGDAVTNAAIDRDVQLIKDAGFDFIRGSHYPHDPHFAEATDRLGMLFLTEAPFWGTAGFPSDWASSAYPTDPSDRAAFEATTKQQLAEMIRINRNHPSIVAWGMDNEVFFSDKAVMDDVRRLLREMVALSHQLDPSRPAAIDGAQRGDIDHLGDIAGYNGDGAWMFLNPGIPNLVAEYGSTMEDRPGTYAPGWGDLPQIGGKTATTPQDWRFPWRSGEVIWCGFDHGSIAGRKFGSMGILDYSRLPKRQWYWYRNAYRGIAPPAWPQAGTAAALRITASSPTIAHADGTDDVQLVVTVVDAQGRALSNSPPVALAIESGPGELPTGRAIHFAPDSDIPIRDGQAAIAMRSWQAGKTLVRATSPGLKDGVIAITTLSGPPFVAGVTPVAADRPYVAWHESGAETVFGRDNPTGASSAAPDHPTRFVNDGDAATYWAPAAGDKAPWVMVDPERILEVHKLTITFPQKAAYGVAAEILRSDGSWVPLVEAAMGGDDRREREFTTQNITGGRIRIKLLVPNGAVAGIAEFRITGVLKDK